MFNSLLAVLAIVATLYGTPTQSVITAYSCQPHVNNPMVCGTTRWGYDPLTSGAACPVLWRERKIIVDGVVYRCDDTPRHDYIYGLPHIDLRLPTYEQAVNHGIQEKTIFLLP